MGKIIVDPEVKAAQCYDLLVDEMRIQGLSNIEAEICFAMMLGAMLSVAYDTDKEVIESMKRITEEAGLYYEKAKRLTEQQRKEERVKIVLDS